MHRQNSHFSVNYEICKKSCILQFGVAPLYLLSLFMQTGGVGLENAKLCPRCTSRCFCTRVTQKTSASVCVRDFVLNSFTQPQPNLGLSQALEGALGVLAYCLVSHY